jgi:hypothetical protein
MQKAAERYRLQPIEVFNSKNNVRCPLAMTHQEKR